MADLSKIKLNNIEYNLKDAAAREAIETLWENPDVVYVNSSDITTVTQSFWNTTQHKLVVIRYIGDENLYIVFQADYISNYIKAYRLGYSSDFKPYYISFLTYYQQEWSLEDYAFGEIPSAESMSNVEAMLEDLGLNSDADLEPAMASSFELDHAVVQAATAQGGN